MTSLPKRGDRVLDCERLVREGVRSYACNKPEGHDGPCGSRGMPEPESDYTRGRRDGMRRAVEIARELEAQLPQYIELTSGDIESAVESELAK